MHWCAVGEDPRRAAHRNSAAACFGRESVLMPLPPHVPPVGALEAGEFWRADLPTAVARKHLGLVGRCYGSLSSYRARRPHHLTVRKANVCTFEHGSCGGATATSRWCRRSSVRSLASSVSPSMCFPNWPRTSNRLMLRASRRPSARPIAATRDGAHAGRHSEDRDAQRSLGCDGGLLRREPRHASKACASLFQRGARSSAAAANRDEP